MTRDDYNRKLQDVQEIEAQTGLRILEPFEHHAADGSIAEGGFVWGGRAVFRQTKPFTPEASYWIDEHLWCRIVYSDATR